MTRINKDIYWVGAIDWDLRNFHGYSTPSGSTYNAYLIGDESPTLIDTVKPYGWPQMLSRIKEAIDPSRIAYIVSNHTEMDHSGSIEELLRLCPEAQVICSPKGAEGLQKHFKKNWKFKIVNHGDTVSIGKRTLSFFLMPMVHWPDSMATYSALDRILFPNDAFGQHYASAERYADEVGFDIVAREALKYYANIVLPYSSQVSKVLEELEKVPFDMICPSHGLIWRNKEHVEKIVRLYGQWARHQSEQRAVVIYDTMWHSTEKMATRLAQLIDRDTIPVTLINLKTTHISDAVTEVMRSKGVILGSPILNGKMLPSVGAFLIYLRGLKPRKRFGFTFGSYGWAPGGFKELEEMLADSGIELVGQGAYVQYVPGESELDGLKALANAVKAVITKEVK